MSFFPKYNLICRADFDGLVAASLLKQKERIASVRFVAAQEVAEGDIEVGNRDILVNLPWKEGVKRGYDHRPSDTGSPQRITRPGAPSTSRVVWDHFGGGKKFPRFSEELIAAADKFSAATYTLEDVETPRGWELLSFLLDTHSGLSLTGNFSLPHHKLLEELTDLLPERPAQEVIAHPDLSERAMLYASEQPHFREQLLRNSRWIAEGVLWIDFRTEGQIRGGNRYLAYALFPECTVSIQAHWGFMKERVCLSMGRSIFSPRREKGIDVGAVMRRYGGGGHAGAGKCLIKTEDLEKTLEEMTAEIASFNSK